MWWLLCVKRPLEVGHHPRVRGQVGGDVAHHQLELHLAVASPEPNKATAASWGRRPLTFQLVILSMARHSRGWGGGAGQGRGRRRRRGLGARSSVPHPCWVLGPTQLSGLAKVTPAAAFHKEEEAGGRLTANRGPPPPPCIQPNKESHFHELGKLFKIAMVIETNSPVLFSGITQI